MSHYKTVHVTGNNARDHDAEPCYAWNAEKNAACAEFGAFTVEPGARKACYEHLGIVVSTMLTFPDLPSVR